MSQINNSFIPKSFYDTQTGALTVDQKLAEDVQAGVQARMETLPPAQQEAFRQMVANLAPGDVDTPKELNAVLDAFQGAASRLGDVTGPVVAFIGDIARFLARALIEYASEQRQNALNDRLQAREQAKADLLAQADKMKEAAAKMESGALTAVITGVIAASVSFIGSAASAAGSLSQLKTMGSAAQQTKTASGAATQATQELDTFTKMKGVAVADNLGQNVVDKLDGKIQNATNKLQVAQLDQAVAQKVFDTASTKAQGISGAGQATNALGDISGSVGRSEDTKAQAEAKKKEAEGSVFSANAQEQQQIADMKKDTQDQMNELIKKMIDFLKELKDAEVDAMRAITRG